MRSLGNLTIGSLAWKVADVEIDLGSGFVNLWGGFTFTLGFLIVFRTQIANGRYWEAISCYEKIHGS